MKPIPWLIPVSWLYGAGVWLRNRFYDAKLFRMHTAGVPVISVGNISAGGTGKTPLVEYLAQHLSDSGKRVAVLSRGYGRLTSGYQVVSNGRQQCADAVSGGDEPAQMAENLKNVIVVVDERRAKGAQRIINEFNPELILLDDGFQHRGLERAMDIVVITTREILTRPALLPAGYRREPWNALARADYLVISDWSTEEEYRRAESRLAEMVSKPVTGMQVLPVGISRLVTGASSDRGELRGKKFVAFSGIGNPESFDRTAAEYLQSPVRHEALGDHHRYAPQDLKLLGRIAEEVRAEYLLTTQKDGMRLLAVPGIADLDKRFPVYVLRVQAVLKDGELLMKCLMESF